MMNLDEAIFHAREKAEENKKAASRFAYPDKAGTTKESADCLECAKEHEQLAEWLTELKNMKDCIKTECFKCAKDKATIDNDPKVAVNCKDCDGYEAGYSAGLKDAERPQGEWIKVTKAGTVPVEYICSLCRRKIYDNYELTTPIDEFYPFCHCGADMRKGGAV